MRVAREGQSQESSLGPANGLLVDDDTIVDKVVDAVVRLEGCSFFALSKCIANPEEPFRRRFNERDCEAFHHCNRRVMKWVREKVIHEYAHRLQTTGLPLG